MCQLPQEIRIAKHSELAEWQVSIGPAQPHSHTNPQGSVPILKSRTANKLWPKLELPTIPNFTRKRTFSRVPYTYMSCFFYFLLNEAKLRQVKYCTVLVINTKKLLHKTDSFPLFYIFKKEHRLTCKMKLRVEALRVYRNFYLVASVNFNVESHTYNIFYFVSKIIRLMLFFPPALNKLRFLALHSWKI